jgi:hypothetical protein
MRKILTNTNGVGFILGTILIIPQLNLILCQFFLIISFLISFIDAAVATPFRSINEIMVNTFFK